MASLEEILVEIKAETSQLRAEMQSASKVVSSATDKMDSALSEFSKNSGKNTSFTTQAFATMTGFLGSQAVIGVFNAVKDAFGFLTENLIDGAKEAAADEEAFARLANSLALTGNYSKQAVSDLQDFADEMEGLAGVGSDVIASNLAVLSSLTKLSGEGLKQAEKAAIDLAAATGKDLSTATDIVAKAINGNDMALKKMGISMALTGDNAKNLEIVTSKLNSQFGGAAAAKMQTFSGSLFVLKDAFGDMFKEVAKTITQNQVVITVMQEVGKIFQQITQYFKDNAVQIRDGVGSAIIYVIDAFTVLTAAADAAIKLIIGGFNAVKTVLNGVVETFLQLNGLSDLGDFSETAKSWEATKSAFTDTSTLENVGTKLAELKNTAQASFDQMKDGPVQASASQDGLKNKIQEVTNFTKEQGAIVQAFGQGLADSVNQVSNQFAFGNQIMKETFDQRMAMIGDDYAAQQQAQLDFFALQQEAAAAQYQSEGELLAQARADNLLTEQQYLDAKLGLAQKYAIDNAKQQTAVTQFNAQAEKTRQDNFKSTMGTIAGLANSGNKELAAIGKAAAITNATIDGYAAVQKALASAPPPFNFALAGLVGAATAANVAKIAGVGLKSGITEVPRSSGGGNSGDNFPAVLQSGERVVDSATNQDLKEFLSRQNGGANVNINITVMPNTGLNNEQVGNLVEQFNQYFSSGGLKLLGAT